MAGDERVEELRRRKALAKLGGGKERTDAQRAKGGSQSGRFRLGGDAAIDHRRTPPRGVVRQRAALRGLPAAGAGHGRAMTDLTKGEMGGSNVFFTGPGVIRAVTGGWVRSVAL